MVLVIASNHGAEGEPATLDKILLSATCISGVVCSLRFHYLVVRRATFIVFMTQSIFEVFKRLLETFLTLRHIYVGERTLDGLFVNDAVLLLVLEAYGARLAHGLGDVIVQAT